MAGTRKVLRSEMAPAGRLPAEYRTHSLRKRKQIAKAWCGRAQAPEREPRSTVRLPSVKPPSVLVPCGLRAQSGPAAAAHAPEPMASTREGLRAEIAPAGRHGPPMRQSRWPARCTPSVAKDRRQRPPGGEHGPETRSGGLKLVSIVAALTFVALFPDTVSARQRWPPGLLPGARGRRSPAISILGIDRDQTHADLRGANPLSV